MKIIKDNDTVIAIFVPKDTEVDGIKFVTPDDYPLQIGLLEHKNGKDIPPHIHKDLNYNVNTTQEFIYVAKGSGVEVTVFNKDWKELDKVVMSEDDSILFVTGGHSLKIPKGCRLIEVKQGPYPGEKEAKIFKSN